VFCLFPIQLQGGPRSLVHLQPAPSYFVTMSCLGLGTPKSTNHAWDPHAWCLGLPCLALPCLGLTIELTIELTIKLTIRLMLSAWDSHA